MRYALLFVVTDGIALGQAAVAAAIAWQWLQAGGTLVYILGGWLPPLGIALRADGPAVTMMLAVS